jgi:dihydrofolate reductase
VVSKGADVHPDGVASAVEQAKSAAGRKDVQVIGGASVAQQLIGADLLDQIQISLMPLLLGDGLRLFKDIGTAPRRLEKIALIDSPARTDIRYRLVRP